MAWLVCVNLDAIARRISRVTTHHNDDFDALTFLSCTHNGIPSAFRQTLKFGWFYSAVDPSLLLEPSEIEVSLVVSYHHRPSLIDPQALEPGE
jgi:hypothetical protein